jgi:hypothetical protein
MPTCAAVEFTFEVTAWGDIGGALPTRVGFDSPKKG